MRFKELFPETITGNVEIEVYKIFTIKKNERSAEYVGNYISSGCVPEHIQEAEVISISPTPSNTLTVAIKGERQDDED